MVSEWKRYALEDCMEAIIDYRGKTPKKTTSGVPLITAKIIKNGTILPIAEFIAEEEYESWMRRGIPEPGDIVLTTEAPLGEVAQLDDRKIALAQRVITLRGKKGFLDNTFLRYLLQSTDVQYQLDGRGTGTTVKGIKQSELRKVELPIPDITTQKYIANILKSLDDKIELNKKINQTLEQMAQALFKSWFVDFAPVFDNLLDKHDNNLEKAKAYLESKRAEDLCPKLTKRFEQRQQTKDQKPLPQDIRNLFPSDFHYNQDLGWIPEGWEQVVFEDVCDAKQGKYIPKADMTEIPDDKNKYPVWGGNGVRGYASKFIYEEPVVVITCRGSNSGKIDLTKGKSWVSNISFGCIPIVGTVNFIKILFSAIDFSDCISGSAQPQITFTSIRNKQLPYPINKIVVEKYSEFIDKLFQKINGNDEQIKVLDKSRDTLLPRLISGKIKVE